MLRRSKGACEMRKEKSFFQISDSGYQLSLTEAAIATDQLAAAKPQFEPM